MRITSLEAIKNSRMKHIITFSGGKDSLATICWAMKNLPFDSWEIAFCDTGWESHITYQHIKDIEAWTGKNIIVLHSKKYKDFVDLCIKKGRVPSTKARFCTEELKVKPMIDYILSLNCDVVVYQGVRWEESESRRSMKKNDEYFRFYFEPYKMNKKGEPVYHTYNKKRIIAYTNAYSVDVCRPIIELTANEVFDMIFASGLKANPLYYMGFSRVGCFPCIMCRKDEIRLIVEKFIERIDEIRTLERTLGRTFFPPKYIPEKYCKNVFINKRGLKTSFPAIDEVVRYVTGNPDQMDLYAKSTDKCISVYNICERNSN
jgi:3'-phosphoadenosine 5'-phosphosulfate sulfotransferase (PAPS reductase)/FAD synthetase